MTEQESTTFTKTVIQKRNPTSFGEVFTFTLKNLMKTNENSSKENPIFKAESLKELFKSSSNKDDKKIPEESKFESSQVKRKSTWNHVFPLLSAHLKQKREEKKELETFPENTTTYGDLSS